jgi:predicted Zn-dependent peptidase
MTAPTLDAFEVTAGSGLRIIAAARSGTPVVELRLVIPFEPADASEAAAGELLAASLFGGIDALDRAAIDGDLATIGASWSASVLPEHLTITAYALADRLPRLLDRLARVLTSATFPDDDVTAQRIRLAHRLTAHVAQPHIAARDALLTKCFGDHPAAREHPDPADVRRVDPADVRDMHRRHLVPDGATLILAGDLDAHHAAAVAAEALSGWTGSTPSTPRHAPPSPAPGPVALYPVSDERQVVVGVSGAAPIDSDPGFAAAFLANLVLGGYFGARLFGRLREEAGFVYRISSTLSRRGGTGLVTVRFATDPRRVPAAMAATYRELSGIAGAEPPTDAEIAAARGYAIGSRVVAVADPAGLADALAGLVQRRQHLTWLHDWPARLAAVPAADVRAAAAELFRPETMTGVVLGPVAALSGAPSPLGGRLVAAFEDETETLAGGDR